MARRYSIISLFFITLFLSLSAQAATTTTVRQVIVTPAPEPKEVVVVPEGYTNCFTVAAGWYNNEWIPEHQVCQYANAAEGVAWVQGYWACNKYNENHDCTNWLWKPGRWVKTFEVY